MNPKHEYEVYTSTDKDQRDRLFQALRASSDPFERKAVKFSGFEPVLDSDGKQLIRDRVYTATGKGGKINFGRVQHRLVYRSTWSVAHPKAENF